MNDVGVGLLAFLGAGIGSSLGYLATRAATQVERVARRREEWGRRFATAVEAVTSSDPSRKDVGIALLTVLVRSPLATEEDRIEALAVTEAVATYADGVDLRLVTDADGLNAETFVEDTGAEPDANGGLT